MLCGTRIAIFHDDSEIAAKIAKIASEADLVVTHPASSALLKLNFPTRLLLPLFWISWAQERRFRIDRARCQCAGASAGDRRDRAQC